MSEFKMQMNRAGLRRVKKHRAREQRYAKSGFDGALVRYVGTHPKPSKYMPHIGKKQLAKAAAMAGA